MQNYVHTWVESVLNNAPKGALSKRDITFLNHIYSLCKGSVYWKQAATPIFTRKEEQFQLPRWWWLSTVTKKFIVENLVKLELPYTPQQHTISQNCLMMKLVLVGVSKTLFQVIGRIYWLLFLTFYK